MGKKSGVGSKKVALDFDPLEALFDLPDPISPFDPSDNLLDSAGDDGDVVLKTCVDVELDKV